MKIQCKKLAVLLLFWLMFLPGFTAVSLAEPSIVFGSFPIPGLVIDKNKGRFIILAKEMARRAGIKSTMVILPAKRAMLHFIRGQTTVFFPVVEEKFPVSFKYARTHEPVFTKRNYIFTLKKEKLLNSYSDLKGLRVGLTRGFSYSKQLTAYSNSLGESHVELVEVNDDETGARMLLAGRFDAFLAEETSGKKAFQNIGSLEQIQYDQASPVGVQKVFFAVNLVEGGGDLLANRLSDALSQMKKDGSFEQIMSNK